MLTGLADESNKDRDELIALVLERSETLGGQKCFGLKQFHPIKRFVGFPQTVAELGEMLGRGPGALGFTIICPDRTAGTEKLFTPNLSHAIACRQGAIRMCNPPREVAWALPKVSVLMQHW